MSKDAVYTGGVIAVKENGLLKDKIFKLCESDAEEALRVIAESGFGRGAEVESPYAFEELIVAEERDLDAFVREYAPNNAVSAYIFAPRDFHNVKALLKAKALNGSAEGMLAPEGAYSVEALEKCVQEGDFSPLYKELAEAAARVYSSIAAEEGERTLSGAETGVEFAKAEFDYLARACKSNSFLKKLIIKKADMQNILTAFRSDTPENAEQSYVYGGKLTAKHLEVIFGEDADKILRSFENTPYCGFVRACVSARENNSPLTEAEKIYDSLETAELSERKYELKRAEPFLYYVFRRRAEIANVRILFVCMLAGMDESGIKKRLRMI